jgi:U3 small nucleolar ribonucleoprotein component
VPYKPSHAQKLVCTLTLFLETEHGKAPTPVHMRQAGEATEDAIRNRLFGDGFLPDNVYVDRYGVTIE